MTTLFRPGGPIVLPTIFRGCDWIPIPIVWEDEDGNPINLTNWTPFAQLSNGDSLGAVVTQPAEGATVLALTKVSTATLKLGQWDWDWIWWNNAPLGAKYPPHLYGTVVVADPKTYKFP
jgi:hypothetical protein